MCIILLLRLILLHNLFAERAKRGFFILSYLFIVVFIKYLFLISFAVNAFLFCELNSFLRSDEIRIAFYWEVRNNLDM